MVTETEPTQTQAEGTQTATEDTSADDLLAQIDAPQETEQNQTGDGTEGEKAEPSLEETANLEAIEARAQLLAEEKARETEARLKKERAERDRQESEAAANQAIHSSFVNFAQDIRGQLNDYDRDTADSIVNAASSMQAQVQRVHALTVLQQLSEQLPEESRDEFRRKYSEDIINSRTGYPQIVAALKEKLLEDPEIHKGYVSEKQRDSDVAQAKRDLIKKLQANPSLLTNPSRAPMTVNGIPQTTGGGLTWQRWEDMSFTEREEYRRDHADEVNALTARRMSGR